MKVKLNTGMVDKLFSGCYETMWSELYDYDDDGNEWYLCFDPKNHLDTIVDSYNDADILKELDIPWIKSIKFTGHYSPRQYNFSTDSLDFTLEVDKRMLNRQVKSLLNDDNWGEFLRDNYTSYDGFISFTPNTPQDIADNILNNGDSFDQSISAVINYLGNFRGLEEFIFDDWRCNGYGGMDWWVECPKCYKKMSYDMNGTYHCKKSH